MNETVQVRVGCTACSPAYPRVPRTNMGFLKSLSQSIKRSAIQQSTADSVTDSGFALPDAQSIETDVDTAGIKRPSGQGEIARRERRRSSTIGVLSRKPSSSDHRVSPPVSLRKCSSTTCACEPTFCVWPSACVFIPARTCTCL